MHLNSLNWLCRSMKRMITSSVELCSSNLFGSRWGNAFPVLEGLWNSQQVNPMNLQRRISPDDLGSSVGTGLALTIQRVGGDQPLGVLRGKLLGENSSRGYWARGTPAFSQLTQAICS
jgi:hypothetical protein